MYLLILMILSVHIAVCVGYHATDTANRFQIDTEDATVPLEQSNVRSNTRTMWLPGQLRSAADQKHSGVRVKRSQRSPEHLARIFQRAYNNPDTGLSGEILYVARKACHADFTLRRRLFRNKEILKAELNIYKKPLKRSSLLNTRVVHAIVSVHQVLNEGERFDSTKLIDSKLVRVDASGWIKFDVTSVVEEWRRCRHCNKGLDIWVESVKPGSRAAKIARRFKFVDATSKDSEHTPALILFFMDKAHNH